MRPSPLLATLALLSQTSLVTALWPIPSSYSLGSTAMWIGRDVKVEVITAAGASNVGTMTLFEQEQNPLMTTISPSDEIISAAVQRTHDIIFKHGYVPWRFHTRNSNFEPDPSTNGSSAVKSITLIQKSKDVPNVLKPAVNEVEESYRLQLTVDGKATITANSSIGIARGLTTFSQLFYAHTAGGSYTPYAPVDVTDAPHFGHRGLNMDLSRAYFPPADIKKTIDALAFNKYNRLHLHITDAQSWPLVIPSMPELSAKGAYRASFVYDKNTLEELQRYGALQGVEVYLEIDMPGHTSSIAYSHPELIASFNIQPNWATYAAEPPSGTLKLNSSAVNTFVEKLFADLFPRISSYTTYMHTGGDEVNANAYLNDDTVKSNDSDVIQPLMQKFIDHSHDIVRKAGLTPMVWEEMLNQWNLSLGKDVIVQTWRSDQAVAQSVQSGYKTLVGNYNYWYLDCGQGQWLNFNANDTMQYYPYNDYCSPRKNWRLMYSYSPYQGVPANLTHLVVGGEVHAWAEQMDPVNFDRQVWPRASAAGEVLWSGPAAQTVKDRSQAEAALRISDMRERLVAMGVMAEPLQMAFCTMESGQCGL